MSPQDKRMPIDGGSSSVLCHREAMGGGRGGALSGLHVWPTGETTYVVVVNHVLVPTTAWGSNVEDRLEVYV